MRRAGFTMIEVIAVVLLLGLLAGASALSLAQSAQDATRADAVARIGHVDAMTRMAARRLGRHYNLRIDLDRQRLERGHRNRDRGMTDSQMTELPSAFRVDRVIVGAVDESLAQVSKRDVTSGALEVTFSDRGLSNSYAVLVRPVRQMSELDNEASCWLVFSGLTGQMVVLDNEDGDTDSQIEELFRSISRGGIDAG